MSSSDTPKTILLRGDPLGSEAAAAVSADIVPGMLIERAASGTVRPHSTAAGAAAILVAREADFVGGGIDDVYEDGDRVPFWNGRKGDWFYMTLAIGQNVAANTFLESNGAGALRDVATAGEALFQALEAVNNSAGSAPARIKVEVL